MISNGLNANCTLITYHRVEVSMDTSVNTQQEIMNHTSYNHPNFAYLSENQLNILPGRKKTRLPNHEWQKAELSKS